MTRTVQAVKSRHVRPGYRAKKATLEIPSSRLIRLKSRADFCTQGRPLHLKRKPDQPPSVLPLQSPTPSPNTLLFHLINEIDSAVQIYPYTPPPSISFRSLPEQTFFQGENWQLESDYPYPLPPLLFARGRSNACIVKTRITLLMCFCFLLVEPDFPLPKGDCKRKEKKLPPTSHTKKKKKERKKKYMS